MSDAGPTQGARPPGGEHPSDDGAPAPGLRGAAARLAASTVGLLRTRVELASVEFIETRNQLREQLVLFITGLVALLFALLFVAVWIIVYFWDTNRLTAVAGVVVVFAALGAILLWRRAEVARSASPPFAASLAELDHDQAAFTRFASSRPPPPP